MFNGKSLYGTTSLAGGFRYTKKQSFSKREALFTYIRNLNFIIFSSTFTKNFDCRRFLRRRSFFVKNNFVSLPLPNCRLCLQFESRALHDLFVLAEKEGFSADFTTPYGTPCLFRCASAPLWRSKQFPELFLCALQIPSNKTKRQALPVLMFWRRRSGATHVHNSLGWCKCSFSV